MSENLSKLTKCWSLTYYNLTPEEREAFKTAMREHGLEYDKGGSECQVPQIAGQDNLGYLSGVGESNNDPSIISSGRGDSGGKSYGAFQFASKSGIPLEFVQWLKENDKDMYNKLLLAYNADEKIYGTHFDNAWKEIAQNNKDDFLKMQYLFTQQKYYDNATKIIKNDIDFDFNERSFALKNVLWSRMVQHGNVGPVETALKSLDLETVTDEDIIRAIYAESGCVVDIKPNEKSIQMTGIEAEKYGLNGKYMKYFSKNNSDNQIGVWIRLTQNGQHEDKPDSEVDRVLEMLTIYG